MATNLLPEFGAQNGSYVNSLRVLPDGTVSQWGHSCTKPGCNCVGGWWEGFEHEDSRTLFEDEVREMAGQ